MPICLCLYFPPTLAAPFLFQAFPGLTHGFCPPHLGGFGQCPGQTHDSWSLRSYLHAQHTLTSEVESREGLNREVDPEKKRDQVPRQLGILPSLTVTTHQGSPWSSLNIVPIPLLTVHRA
jgi:hypothetical protein